MLGGVEYLYVQLTCRHTRHQKMFNAILLTRCHSIKDALSQIVWFTLCIVEDQWENKPQAAQCSPSYYVFRSDLIFKHDDRPTFQWSQECKFEYIKRTKDAISSITPEVFVPFESVRFFLPPLLQKFLSKNITLLEECTYILAWEMIAYVVSNIVQVLQGTWFLEHFIFWVRKVTNSAWLSVSELIKYY